MEFYEILVYIMAYVGIFATSFYFINLITYYRKKPEEKEKDNVAVTIIIPAYNEEDSIARTIESALSINYQKDKLEIIIVDDGSKDRTYEIANKFVSRKNPIVKILAKPNGGKGSALNLGIKNAKGEIIVSMDADSFVKPDALKKMVAMFDNERVMAVTPSMGVYNPKGILQRIQQIEYYMGVFLRKALATINSIHITPGAFSAYRKSFFQKYGGYDENNIVEDLEIALRIQAKGYVIENSPRSIVYTIVPNTFKSLLTQRRRWYSGLMKNLLDYKRLFGFKKGPLGTIVLPVALLTIFLSVFLTSYIIIKSLIDIKNDLLSMKAINFRFNDYFELNNYMFKNFIYQTFSSQVFLISLVLIGIIIFYLVFSRRHIKFTEKIKFSFIIYIFFYSILFTIWWIFSTIDFLFSRKVKWREDKRGRQ